MPAPFDDAFAALKKLFSKYEAASVVMADEPGKYYLGTHFVRKKDGYRAWFGGVEIKKNYVSAHVVAAYFFPDLVETAVSAALKKRMQGKACFNFKQRDDALFRDLAVLLEAGAKRISKDGVKGFEAA